MNISKQLMSIMASLVICLISTGCAGIKGAPDSALLTDESVNDLKCYLKADVLVKNTCNAAPPQDIQTRKFRDTVISARITVADLEFRDFINDLSSQSTSFNIFSDLAVLGLSAAGTLASGGTTAALAAASAGVTGARGAVDKDVYYRETLPSLIRTMEANRKEVLLDIQTKKQLDENQYPLGDALHDLGRYEAAGTLAAALGTITGKADAAANKADQLMTAMSITSIVSQDVQIRRKSLSDYTRTLETNNDKTALDKIAEALGVTITSDIKQESKDIRYEIATKITTSDDMNKISKILNEKIQKAF